MRGLVATLVLLAAALAIAGCREEGATEKAGRKVDEAIDRIQHGDEGALERAGRKVDEAIEEAEKKRKGSS